MEQKACVDCNRIIVGEDYTDFGNEYVCHDCTRKNCHLILTSPNTKKQMMYLKTILNKSARIFDGHGHSSPVIDNIFVTDYTSVFNIKCFSWNVSKHIVFGQYNTERIDVWFEYSGDSWHGVNIGDNTIVRCYKLKGKR